MKKKNSVLLLLVATMVSISLFAQEKDVEGSKDYPLISRYPGSVIETYNLKQFDEYVFPLTRDKANVTKSQQLEGKVTRIGYLAPKDRSTLEMSRSYELALKKAGFEILFTVAGGENWGDITRYLSAKASNVYVNIKVYAGRGPVSVQLDVIEVKPIEEGLITVENISKGMNADGHIAVYDILFETGKADIKPESSNAIKTIADYIKANSGKKFYIVGHTDNAGNFPDNMSLSENRAKSVINELTTKFALNSGQLSAYGVASLSPVASNSTEEGKAKNRRVEIVEQ